MHRGSASSGSPETIFTGVRFVLFGFDSVSEAQYRSELVCRGGTDVGRYDSSCTHVVVCGRVHDDPVCTAALQDGKALVSELWIDDSLDFGALADTERVLYKPVKDLNGIPGCESLCICLTGYQRQERDDIMRMVSLMGARFSKPLIANQVTHLVCYKFEGEKYELAKKVNIKLANHRWLEDCLKAWEILPTDNYIKSGWELEILDAEARDSEEETADPGNTLRNQIVMDPSSSLGGVADKSKVQQVTKPAQQSYNSEDCLRNNIISTPYKEATSGRALDTFLNTKPLEASIHKDAMGIIHAYDNCIIKDAPNDRNESKLVDANLNKDGNVLPSTLRNVKQHSPLSAVADAKSGNQSYSRKTPRKLVSTEEPSTMLSPPKRNLEVSPPKLGEAIENHVSVDIPNPTSDTSIQYSKVHSSSLPQKRKSVFDVSEKSPKFGVPDLNMHVPQSPSARARIEPLEATALLPHSHSSISNGPAGIKFSSDEAAITSSNASEQAAPTKFKSISYKKRSVKQGQPALGSKTSSAVSHFEGNKADMLIDELREILDAPKSITDKSAAVETKTTYDSSPTNRVLPADNQKATDKQPSTKSRARIPGRSRIGVRTREATLPKDIAPKLSLGSSEISEPVSNSELNSNIPAFVIPSDTTGCHIAMSDVANASTEEPGETCTLQQQQEGVLSLDSRNSEIRKLSSSASDVPCKENDVKADTFAHTKKVVYKKTLGSKKRSAENSTKDEVVAFSNITATNEAAVEPSIVGKVKTDTPDGDIAIATTDEPGEACTLQQQGGDSASDVPCKENDVKAATFAHTKKVVSKKNLGSKKRSAGNSTKDKVVASSDRTARNEAAVEPSIVGKVKTDTPGGNIAIATTDKYGKTCTLRQQGVLSPDCRDSDIRELSRRASDAACNEIDGKVTAVHTKKMVSKKNFGGKKRSTVNSRTCKVVASLDRTTTSNEAAADPSTVEKLKAEHKLESGTSGVKTGVEKPVSLVDKVDVIMGENAKITLQSASGKGSKFTATDGMDTPMDSEKENKPRENGSLTVHATSRPKQKVGSKQGRKLMQESKSIAGKNKKESQTNSLTRSERLGPACFMLSGHRLQRKEFQTVIKRLKGRLCSDSHNWSYQATHLIVPDPLRRTEKFFAAAAAGRWILKTDYLTASLEAARFLDEEPFEWHKKGLTEDGAISLEAPRRWRILRERTGHGALYGLRLIIYGDCIAPTLDTLKRAVKAGDGTILATSPPYNRFLKSGADYAIISPGMPHVDIWVQEFLRHEIPCIAADYLVEYVCKPGYSLERHVLYKTHAWADKSFANLLSRSEEVVTRAVTSPVDDPDDVSCMVCGSCEMGEVMLICGDEVGLLGCGSATHIGCCDPPLEAVPDGDWFCPKCSTSRTSKGPLKSRKLSSSTKRK